MEPAAVSEGPQRPRARAAGVAPGHLQPGPLNAITDVPGVRVGHVTLVQGEGIRTGATAVLPHGGNLFQEKVPAGIAVGNGFGKLVGSTQVVELGEIETPVILTNTLAVPRAADTALDWTLGQPGNERVRSANPVVGETNDGLLNDIRARALTPEMIGRSLREAREGAVEEGCVGAGTGTVCMGWKGGIGTGSRVLRGTHCDCTVGALVQTNYGGNLEILGVPVWEELRPEGQGRGGANPPLTSHSSGPTPPDGSVMIVVATDAPLSDRNLTRLARRALLAVARTGSWMANGSGDYAIAFSTAEGARRAPARRTQTVEYPELPNELISPIFQAIVEATEEAIYNSLFRATTMKGRDGVTVPALPVADVLRLLRRHGRISHA